MTANAEHSLDVDLLADRLARGELPEADHAALWRTLLFEVIVPRAQHLEGLLGCETLVDAALDVLPRRLPNYSQAKGRFRSWLETTLRHLARDEQRRRRRWCYLDRSEEVEQPRTGELAVEKQTADEDCRQRLSRALRTLATAPRSNRQKTDFHAVLLVSLRLALIGRLKRSRKILVARGETRTGRAEQQLPWTSDDGVRVIQTGWPSLTKVWAALTLGLEASGDNPTDDCIVGILAELPGVLGINAESWRQWRKRAVAAGRKKLGEEMWTDDVEPWLESRAPRRQRSLTRG